jgi:rhodanese-related sulfurtransferase
MKFNASKIVLSLATAALIIFGVQQLQAAEGVSVKQAQAMTEKGALLLDVREPDEYSVVHAPNARLLSLGQISERLNEISAYKNKPIVVVCRSGKRSARAVKLLQEAGFTQVSNVTGGMNAWESEGLVVIRP